VTVEFKLPSEERAAKRQEYN